MGDGTAAGDNTRGAGVAWLVGLLLGVAGAGSAGAAVALPAVADELHLATSESAWVISVYALMLAVATPLYGRMSDMLGLRLPLTVGVVLMTVGALASALAPGYGWLVVARGLQGVGAAAVPVLSVVAVRALYSGQRGDAALARMMGVAVSSTALSPLLAGTLEHFGGWRLVMAMPVLSVGLLPAFVRSLPAVGDGSRLDVRGAFLVAITASGLLLVIQSPSSGRVWAAVGAAALLFGVPNIVRHTRRNPDGYLPRRVISRAEVTRTAIAASVVPASWFALLVALPASLAARGLGAIAVGLALFPGAVVAVLAPRLVAIVIARLGPRRSIVVSCGAVCLALGVAALGEVAGSITLLVLGTIGVNGAMGLVQPSMMVEVAGAVPARLQGVALGIEMLIFLVGAGVGSGLAGGLFDLMGSAQVLLVVILLPLLGAVLMLLRPSPASGQPL